jgi:hypothetical protein
VFGNRVCCDVCRHPAGRTVTGLDLSRPKLGRVRIETEDELTLSLFNEICQTIAKRLRRGLDQPPLTVCLSFAPAENFGTLLALI